MALRSSHSRPSALRGAPLFAVASLVVMACAPRAASPPPLAPSTPGAAAGAGSRDRTPLPRDIVARSALPLHALEGGRRLSEPELWDRLSTYRLVCLGEQHDSPQHHFAQRRAIEELGRRSSAAKRPFSVGFEMFQTPYQPALTGFASGTLPEAELLTQSEYAQRWGFDFSLYRPLLEAARELGLSALALNAPRELTRKIGRSGLAALDAREAEQLPELDLGNADHRAYFTDAMAGHPMPAGGPSLDDMYAVQVVWDETMADTAVRWLEAAGPGSQALVLAGAGHCHQSAIPGRAARRLKAPVLGVSVVLESKLDELESRDRYDWLLVLEDRAP
jgi:uncharacterized iron-regulated protein